MMLSTVTLLGMSTVLVGQKEVFVGAVCRESDRCNAKAGEKTLETIATSELSRISPRLTMKSNKVSADSTRSLLTYRLFQGSFSFRPEALAMACALKPVRLGLAAALRMLEIDCQCYSKNGFNCKYLVYRMLTDLVEECLYS